MNKEGYRNLCKLVSLGYMEGFYYKPRIDKDLLKELNGGLIALSACLQGEVSQALNYGDYEKAKARSGNRTRRSSAIAITSRFKTINSPEQEKVNRHVASSLAKELSIPVVATNDCHYGERADFHAHDVLLCVQTGKTVSDDQPPEDRHRRALSQIRRRDESGLRLLSRAPWSGRSKSPIAAIVEIEFGKYHFPNFTPPKEISLDDYLDELAHQGLEQRLEGMIDAELRKSYVERLEYELDVIKRHAISRLLLVVADFINYAKENGIPVGPGRGSSAGSLVAYALHNHRSRSDPPCFVV